MNKGVRSIVLSLVLVAAAAATVAGSARGSHPNVPSGRIAFVKVVGNSEIFTMSPDGTDLVNLTNNRARDRYPAWSSDGSKIAWVRGPFFNSDLWVMNADGSNPTQVTHTGATQGIVNPSWSPDGSRIAFSRFSAATLNPEIWTVSLADASETQLTNLPGVDTQPAWSPNGKKIAFLSERSGSAAIYTMRADGSKVKKLTDDALSAGEPSWSPDGERIAFIDNACPTCPNLGDLYTMEADGSDIVKLTNTPDVHEEAPSWSPDGRWLSFDSTTDFFWFDVSRIPSDGGPAINLTNTPTTVEFMPQWSPGTKSDDNHGD